jgi:hypothetical protein
MRQLVLPGVLRALDLEPLLRPALLSAMAACLLKFCDPETDDPETDDSGAADATRCGSVAWGTRK